MCLRNSQIHILLIYNTLCTVYNMSNVDGQENFGLFRPVYHIIIN